ncbi:PTS transporter subunit IIABC [Allofournierella massiliensis]|uniref:PTS system D-glucosamine-specific IIC component n=1 Tax=Allofournierella massiliensis TaxID=1650663 RepID=A0A4R1QV11_9FIRM|nr:PTS transporter subunit IIABC [Fournierella massiliensis]TCL57796.1 PTS system D-glucosamine-specific IIC component [Fournierella massiliensis]
MKDKIFGVLQRVGRSFMLPIAILPVAGLFLGIGGSLTNETMLEAYGLMGLLGPGTFANAILQVLNSAGSVVFNNLPIIFAMGVAIGMAKQEKEVAALASAIAFFIMHATIGAMIGAFGAPDLAGATADVLGMTSLQMGVFGGILVGLGTAALHNRFYKIQLPQVLSFFSGTRFVPIISSAVYLLVGIAMYYIWPTIQIGINALGGFVLASGYAGTWLYGFIERALIPFGLHHVFYIPFWQTAVGGTAVVGGQLVEGAQNIFFAELATPGITHFSVSATRFMTGKFPLMIFGLPGAAFAMYRCAKPENRKAVGGLLLSAALTSMLTGITEPLEFTFLFVAPAMYMVHCVLAGASYMIMHILNVGVGLTFSGGLIDLTLFGIMQGNEKTSWLWIPVVGVVYFVVYYFVFSFMIRKFNYMTPGRDDNAEAKLYTRKDLEARKKAGEVTEAEAADELSAQITQGLGGKDNISDVDCCITRLRCTVKDPAKVDQQLLKSTGASGVICKGQGVQVVYGPRVSVIKSDLEAYLKSSASDHPAPVAKPAQEAKPVETKPADAPKAGGGRLTVVSPLAGKIIPVEEVADGVFSEKMVGDGFAVEPEADEVLAPADGEITLVFDTKHAFTMRTAQGVDLLVHMGIDTIRLNGEPFTLSIKQGDVVKAGQPIGTMDRAAILAAGYRTVTPVVVGNLADLGGFKLTRTGEVKAGDAVMEVF